MNGTARLSGLSVLGLVLVVNFWTAGMGTPIAGEGGKLAVSNLTPVAFVAIAGFVYLCNGAARVPVKLAGLLLLFNLCAVASFTIFYLRYQWEPNLLVLVFQNVQIVFCLLLIWYAHNNPLELRAVARAGIYGFALVAAFYGWKDFSDGQVFSSFGMDDKSQGAVLLCAAAFILIRFSTSPLDRAVGLGLYVLSFLSISRLPAFFLPAIALALMKGSRFGVLLAVIAAGVLGYVLAVAEDALAKTFAVYDRLSSLEAITESGSTSAHLMLLELAGQMKFSDPWAFFFGIGPGNFSKALISFPVSVTEIEAIDPQLVAFAREGRAPLHSTVMQLLLDYNLILFLLFAFGLLWLARYLLRRGNLVDMAFFSALFLAACFYSVHNKPYFFLYVTTIGLLLRAEQERPARSVSPAPTLDTAPAG